MLATASHVATAWNPAPAERTGANTSFPQSRLSSDQFIDRTLLLQGYRIDLSIPSLTHGFQQENIT